MLIGLRLAERAHHFGGSGDVDGILIEVGRQGRIVLGSASVLEGEILDGANGAVEVDVEAKPDILVYDADVDGDLARLRPMLVLLLFGTTLLKRRR